MVIDHGKYFDLVRDAQQIYNETQEQLKEDGQLWKKHQQIVGQSIKHTEFNQIQRITAYPVVKNSMNICIIEKYKIGEPIG